ncbi:DUF1146 family protein [Alkalibacterium putridalgicola]|jgi:uncharacterized integral membrane protein (TIGR02327 family)|uniref:Membrane protein n=1 Tax=Alkalibacterium putridalgicola TaxID=426703 RepID=A0A1H7RWA1_9LACT|nr:DUF1146 family protein [Alkalibacterium putridalgicola]GEK88309.1 membrane protein [Alkalibacterium putridalgicola]SEL64581.1 conserved hypothetical integral membrane protein [Alkalibacterium putridalgicola]
MPLVMLQSLVNLVSHVFFVLVVFWAMQALKTDVLIKKHHIPQARTLYIVISIAVGYTVSNFFIDFILSIQNLFFLF